jgi:hypothetical protein
MQADAAVLGAPVATFAQLLDRMTAIDQALPATDGVACFNRMYRLVIESVQAHVTAGFFGDPAWIARLDIVFANLYLKAFQGVLEETAATPRAWAPLLDRRSDQRAAAAVRAGRHECSYQSRFARRGRYDLSGTRYVA